MTLTQMIDAAHWNAVSKGWHEGSIGANGQVNPNSVPVLEKIALIHSELSEAVEAYRDYGITTEACVCADANPDPDVVCIRCEDRGEKYIAYGDGGKPEGFTVELADTIIRIFDLAGALRLPLEEAILEKMRYNETREYRHGGKKA